MKKPYAKLPVLVKGILLLLLCAYGFKARAQTEQRIMFNYITPSVNTGQDYSPWLNDNLDSLVQDNWTSANFAWVDVTLRLTQHSIITRLLFYDGTGVFTDQPDSIYALNGNVKTFLGVFTGPAYMVYDGFTLAAPVEADAIIMHKYCNNIPEKVQLFGTPDGPPFGPPVDTAKTIIPPADTAQLVQIPVDTNRWYQLDNVTGGLGGLFDGNLTGSINTGWGKMMNNYDAYYPVAKGERIDLYKIKFFSYEGGLGSYPLTVSVIDSTGTRTNIATFVGGVYDSWVGPYPGDTTFSLHTPIKNVRYIVLNCWFQFPTEIQLYGKYTAGPDTTPMVKKAYPLNQYFGANAFEWNFEAPNQSWEVNSSLLSMARSFTQVRHYMDWNKLESAQGEYTFNPVHSGGWNYDAMYAACKTNNIAVLADLKTLPGWLVATYPADQQDAENVPVPYGSDFTDPNSYILQAKVAFQYVARYGGNANVSSSLLSVDTSIRWTADPQNQVMKGMGLVKYIECDNERDKWWKGRKAYQTSYEYAANLSAFYDGNMNTMGPGVGVKNADPNMQVVMGGLASADPTYVHGMIEWCRLHRGYRADGTVNICWDVINYHLYANDAPPNGYATTGVAPELSGTMKTAQAFLQVSHQYANDMPVWVTESGYDINAGSPQRAPAIGDKPASTVQADWILRTSLLYARAGIQRVFFYEMYDDNAANPTQYASSGMINDDQTRRASANYLMQVNKVFGNYSYQKSLSSNPVVDMYQQNGQPAYVLYIPDQVGRTGSYTLDMGSADSAMVYTPVVNDTSMAFTKVPLQGGKLAMTLTETPTFVIPLGTTVNTQTLAVRKAVPNANNTFDSSIKLYPNPTVKYVTVAFSNKNQDNVTINVCDVNMGKVYQTYTSPKSGDDFSQTLDVTNVPMGVYVVQVKQGSQATMRKVIKTY